MIGIDLAAVLTFFSDIATNGLPILILQGSKVNVRVLASYLMAGYSSKKSMYSLASVCSETFINKNKRHNSIAVDLLKETDIINS